MFLKLVCHRFTPGFIPNEYVLDKFMQMRLINISDVAEKIKNRVKMKTLDSSKKPFKENIDIFIWYFLKVFFNCSTDIEKQIRI